MDTLFERELAKRLAQTIEDKTKNLTHTVLLVEEYRHQMGYLQALRHVQELCDAIRSDMDKGSL